uniref:Toxin candidate TRINITY_DN21013_c3_g1_i2 n=1 Tax=Ceriantheomorphe brasiliensis TaxID=1048506 RepID=A0A7G7WZ52_9CNID|nr:toxin candidate TRINITY_DN21013_c3_g1_i2 [Ceriantheomorphe brasiliensis]
MAFRYSVCLLLLRCLCVTSQDVLYFPPMTLGRSFDYSKLDIGKEVFPAEALEQSVHTIPQEKVKFESRVLRSSKDVGSTLHVSGQLSLKLKMGLLSIKGSGEYIKDTSNKDNIVEMLINIQYQTETVTVLRSAEPYADWFTRKNIIGKHYIRAITYGGELIASLKFETKTATEKEKIEAELDAGLSMGGGSVLDAKIEGTFLKTVELASSNADLSIKIFSTADIEEQPKDLKSFVSIIENFVQKVASGQHKGVPIRAHLSPLSQLKGATPQHEFKYQRLLKVTMETLEEYYDDIITTINAMDEWLNSRECVIDDVMEQKLAVFQRNMAQVNRQLVGVMTSLNLNELNTNPMNEINTIDDIYYGDTVNRMPRKFYREFKKIIDAENKAPQLVSELEGYLSVVNHFIPSKKETQAEYERKVKEQLRGPNGEDRTTNFYVEEVYKVQVYTYNSIDALLGRPRSVLLKHGKLTFKTERKFSTTYSQVGRDGTFVAPIQGVYLLSLQLTLKVDQEMHIRYDKNANQYLYDSDSESMCPRTTTHISHPMFVFLKKGQSLDVTLTGGELESLETSSISGTLVLRTNTEFVPNQKEKKPQKHNPKGSKKKKKKKYKKYKKPKF